MMNYSGIFYLAPQSFFELLLVSRVVRQQQINNILRIILSLARCATKVQKNLGFCREELQALQNFKKSNSSSKI